MFPGCPSEGHIYTAVCSLMLLKMSQLADHYVVCGLFVGVSQLADHYVVCGLFVGVTTC